MVSVVHALPSQGVDTATLERLIHGLPASEGQRLLSCAQWASELYGDAKLGTGETTFAHGLGMALILAGVDLDADSRVAALLFAAFDFLADAEATLSKQWGKAVAELIAGLARLKSLRPLTLATVTGKSDVLAQTEILRKMILAMAADVRVVLLRLASRTQTLRWLAEHATPERADIARESLAIYAPLANRLGIWQIKWEIEDLAFRFTDPDTYKMIAKRLDERRLEREAFIAAAITRLKEELAQAGIENAEVYGRPKHIYSIWNKMRQKNLSFEEVYDVRALRIIVGEVKDCYAALGVVHALWQPIHGEFDDYISHPKGNFYRSLHTAVIVEDGKPLEVQIRTHEMHRHAELGIAAHWRYKEAGSGAKANSAYDEKIAWLRELLSWRDEIADSAAWVEQMKRAALDDTIYVVTPAGKVIDLPAGSTPLDFAYRIHSDLGHRCRGAKVDGQLVPLNTPLKSGQKVEIIAAKSGGPSRDWLAPGYLHSSRARQKVKAWFARLEEQESLAQGRLWLTKELERMGCAGANLEELAQKLGCKSVDALFLAAARNEIGAHALRQALQRHAPAAPEEILTRAARPAQGGQILVVGVDNLLTQLARCCKPVPFDAIGGFVTRGKGVSVHRIECANFRQMARRYPERVIEAAWSEQTSGRFVSDLALEANDRQGLLRDISELLTKERINVVAVNTVTRNGIARMRFTLELNDAAQLARVAKLIGEVPGVVEVRR
ncbi:MAG: bifunctional (p)ppGpp synthetase/guanosine-3',5'-bis(diphosphate) 3'-pyrophosphohydrolase [Rhodocyclaceae bacterium]|nr:bifunctional (p)ppGpp synthetase/guanosine-3',5'-bis(diphosphate) 3'-pyrophosphohydrolase [Rhodocyclaceae bacterium]